MGEGSIVCPQCGHEFEVTDALARRIRESVKTELQESIARREAELRKRQNAIDEREEDLETKQAGLDELVATKLKERLAEAEEKATRKIESQYADKLKELSDGLKARDETIKDLREQELELRRQRRELEEAKEAAELDIARKLDEERAKIKEAAARKFEDEHRLKDLEKDKKIRDLNASLDDMKRKVEQGSMETQGEVLEQDLEDQLKALFPHDTIAPVPKGVRGADLVQTVRTPVGTECGVLLWEIKNTKAWSRSWIPKLKEDMVEVRASIAILASVVLPPDVDRFGQVDGVWVSKPGSAISLAMALREQLIAVSRERIASVDKSAKTEMLYQYFSGSEFRQKIEGIVEAFTAMQEQINQERRAMEKHWKMRQKQIERVVKNTAGLYGDVQGIIGGQMSMIPSLELDGGGVKQITDGEEAASESEN